MDVDLVWVSKWCSFWCDMIIHPDWALVQLFPTADLFLLWVLPSWVCVCVHACVRVYWREAIFPVAVAPAELAALMHHGIILDRCCYLCSVSKPIILTQIYVNTAVSWHRMKFTQAQEGSWKHYSVWLFFSVHSTQNVFWEPKNGLWAGQTGKGNRAKKRVSGSQPNKIPTLVSK